MRNAYRVFIGKPDTVKPVVSPSHVLKDVIKFDFKERGSQEGLFSVMSGKWAGELGNRVPVPARDTSKTSRTQPPIQRVPGVERLGLEADHSLTSATEVKHELGPVCTAGYANFFTLQKDDVRVCARLGCCAYSRG
jgi:hypothetical protein